MAVSRLPCTGRELVDDTCAVPQGCTIQSRGQVGSAGPKPWWSGSVKRLIESNRGACKDPIIPPDEEPRLRSLLEFTEARIANSAGQEFTVNAISVPYTSTP